jgi:tetratricopeptide (TPR) repeat protein
MVTSRRQLTGLPNTHQISLNVLPAPDAVALFTAEAGTERLATQPSEMVHAAVRLCWRLPLAVSVAAALLRSHPAWSVADLVDRLRDQHQRLAELDDGTRSVTAAVEVSYHHLPAEQQRLYRLLGLHPGPDIDVHAAAALVAATPERVRRMLERLYHERLLREPAPGRYLFHDLVAAHAAELATAETEATRRAALGRLLDHYRSTAAVAVDTVYPFDRDHRPQVPAPDTTVPNLRDLAQAAGWLKGELSNLLAAAHYAANRGWPEHTLHLSSILRRHMYILGRNRDAEALHRRALTLARTIGDRQGEQYALYGLGEVYRLQGRYDQAADHYHRAVEIARILGDRLGELWALVSFGAVHRLQGRYDQAADHYHQAVEIARTFDDRQGEQYALYGLGEVYRLQGQYDQAADHYHRAVEIARTLGDRWALYGLGEVYRLQGRYDQAADHYHRAVEIARTLDDRLGELWALYGLGELHRLQGRYDQAADHYWQALEIANTVDDRLGERYALYGLGEVYRLQGRYDHAADHYRQALEIACIIGERKGQLEALLGLGRVCRATSQSDAALTHYQQALQLATDLGQSDDQARAHDGLVSCARNPLKI